MKKLCLISLFCLLSISPVWGQFVFSAPHDTEDTLLSPPVGDILSPTVRFDDREVFFESIGVIYRATRPINNQPFMNTAPVPELVASGFINERPFLSEDGLRLYFTRKATSASTVRTLYCASRPTINSNFNQLVNLGPQGSSPFRGRIGSLTGDELKVYLEVPPPGKGISEETNIMVATRDSIGEPFGQWTLVPGINTDVLETDPQVTSDDRTIFFTRISFGLPGAIYSTSRDSLEEPFPTPVLVQGVNQGNATNRGPFVLPSGGRMYFARDGDLVYSDRILEGTYVLQPATAWIGQEFLLPVKMDTMEQDARNFEFSVFFNPNRLRYLGVETTDRLGVSTLNAALQTPAILTVQYQSQVPLKGENEPEEVIAIRFAVRKTVTPRFETVAFAGQAFLNGASIDDLPSTQVQIVQPPARAPSGLIILE
jgi:hypothetical protein